jgi:ribosomal protein S18 acetylase RimI-like enzyme
MTLIGPLWQVEYGDTDEIRAQIEQGPKRVDLGETRIVERGPDRTGVLVVQRRRSALRIEWLLVQPGSQRQGIGTHCVKTVQREARNLGLDVVLEVLSQNLDARHLYERLGFQVTGTLLRMVLLRWSHDPIKTEAVKTREEKT